MAHVDPTKEQFAKFQELDRPGPVQMLNLIRFRERAAYDDGRAVSGAEAYRTYSRLAEAPFSRVGGKQVWLAHFELTLIGPSDEQWDAVFVAEYPDTRSFVSMLRDPEYREAVKHRQAAVADSRLIRLRPRQAGPRFGDAANGS